MNCCEDVLVTLKFIPGEKTLDMELPAFMPAGELGEKILETLRIMNPAAFSRTGELRLGRDGKKLRDGDTLASVGIWDGGILEITFHGEA